jgi:hypothetical protein
VRIARFEDLLDRHGAALETWPEAERIAAEELLAGSAAARRALAKASALHELLARELAPTAAPDSLRAAVERAAPSPPLERARRRRDGLRLAWGVALATASASLVVGFVLGAMNDRVIELDRRAAPDIAGIVYGADLDDLL